MNSKKTYIMYKNWTPMLKSLPNEKLGELMKSILLLQEGIEKPPEDEMLFAMYQMIRETMVDDADKYEQTCIKRQENGKLGGRPKKANGLEENQTKPNGFSENQTKAKKADNDNDNDNDSDNDIDNVIDNDKDIKKKRNTKKKNSFDHSSILHESDLSETVSNKVMDWIRYKHERNQPYKEMGFKALVTQVERYEREYGSTNVIHVIDRTMASNYSGIVWDWLNDTRKQQTKKVNWEDI